VSARATLLRHASLSPHVFVVGVAASTVCPGTNLSTGARTGTTNRAEFTALPSVGRNAPVVSGSVQVNQRIGGCAPMSPHGCATPPATRPHGQPGRAP
jgi:hypothetical protein